MKGHLPVLVLCLIGLCLMAFVYAMVFLFGN